MISLARLEQLAATNALGAYIKVDPLVVAQLVQAVKAALAMELAMWQAFGEVVEGGHPDEDDHDRVRRDLLAALAPFTEEEK